MNDGNSTLQRYGNYLILGVIAALLLLGARATVAGGFLDFEMEVEPNSASLGALHESAEASPSPLPGQTPVPTLDLAAFAARSDSSLAPALNPQTFEGLRPAVVLASYTVARNDTPNGIAERFGIEPSTLLGCNPELGIESSLLQVGTELVICPENGLLHDVRRGETVESVAALYGVEPETIIAFPQNNLTFPFRLYEGTQLFVPGAVRELFVWTPPSLASVTRGNSPEVGGGFTPLVVGTGFFNWPVANRSNITQYYWFGHPGLDIGLPEGIPVYASDTGTVTYGGWSIYCYGNLIVVNHGNGYETFYAHLSAIYVSPGQVVQKGATIGAVGNTGCSSGSHLHFEIRLNATRLDPLSGFLP